MYFYYSGDDWRTASRQSSGIAPNALLTNEAVVQVYGADAWSWRGLFAIHTWIAVKRSGEHFYTVYDVVGWRVFKGQPAMEIERDVPDRLWFGKRPTVLIEHRGERAEHLIDAIHRAALSYPWKTEYVVYPGPNSNTFTAWISQQVPELELVLPWSAIGKNYID